MLDTNKMMNPKLIRGVILWIMKLLRKNRNVIQCGSTVKVIECGDGTSKICCYVRINNVEQFSSHDSKRAEENVKTLEICEAICARLAQSYPKNKR